MPPPPPPEVLSPGKLKIGPFPPPPDPELSDEPPPPPESPPPVVLVSSLSEESVHPGSTISIRPSWSLSMPSEHCGLGGGGGGGALVSSSSDALEHPGSAG